MSNLTKFRFLWSLFFGLWSVAFFILAYIRYTDSNYTSTLDLIAMAIQFTGIIVHFFVVFSIWRRNDA